MSLLAHSLTTYKFASQHGQRLRIVFSFKANGQGHIQLPAYGFTIVPHIKYGCLLPFGQLQDTNVTHRHRFTIATAPIYFVNAANKIVKTSAQSRLKLGSVTLLQPHVNYWLAITHLVKSYNGQRLIDFLSLAKLSQDARQEANVF